MRDSTIIEEVTAEFPVGNNTHVLVTLYHDCIVFQPCVTTSRGYLATDQAMQRCHRFDTTPNCQHVHNGNHFDLWQLRALLSLTYLEARAQ